MIHQKIPSNFNFEKLQKTKQKKLELKEEIIKEREGFKENTWRSELKISRSLKLKERTFTDEQKNEILERVDKYWKEK